MLAMTMKVYKYRGGTCEVLKRDIRSLQKNYFWAPKASELNDVSEATVNSNALESTFARIGDGEAKLAYEALLAMRHSVGVYSLSQTPLSQTMWAYYASSHSGFCIEYDLERLILEARNSWNVVDVSYSENPQELILQDVIGQKDVRFIVEKMIGTKSIEWQHEREIRIITTAAGKNFHASQAVTGIYFGQRCQERTESAIRKIFSKRDLKFYKIQCEPGGYSLRANLLPNVTKRDPKWAGYAAPIDDEAIQVEGSSEQIDHLRKLLITAAEIVRRDPSCRKVSLVCISATPNSDGSPRVLVQYETSVPTNYSNTFNRYFSFEDLESH